MSQITSHPLMQGELAYISSWKQWRELWEKTNLLEFRHSLLHCGFGVPLSEIGEDSQRICFYLELADGHRSSSNFTAPSERVYSGIRTSMGKFQDFSEMRRILAEKAFQALCLNFFKNQEKGHFPTYMPSWARAVAEPAVLDKLIWFFRPGDTHNIENAPCHDEDHHNATAREFAYRLAEFIWRFCHFGEYNSNYDEEICKLFKANRHKFLPILAGLERLNVLFNTTEFPLDNKCFKALEQLVLDKELYFDFDRKLRPPKDIAEAAAAGSRAARVFIPLKVIYEQRAKEEKLRQAKEKQLTATEEVKALSR